MRLPSWHQQQRQKPPAAPPPPARAAAPLPSRPQSPRCAGPFMTLRGRGGISGPPEHPRFSAEKWQWPTTIQKSGRFQVPNPHFRGRKWVIAAVKLLSGVLLVPGPEIMRFFRFGAKAAPSRFRIRKCGLAGTLAARDVRSAALLVPRGRFRAGHHGTSTAPACPRSGGCSSWPR